MADETILCNMFSQRPEQQRPYSVEPELAMSQPTRVAYPVTAAAATADRLRGGEENFAGSAGSSAPRLQPRVATPSVVRTRSGHCFPDQHKPGVSPVAHCGCNKAPSLLVPMHSRSVLATSLPTLLPIAPRSAMGLPIQKGLPVSGLPVASRDNDPASKTALPIPCRRGGSTFGQPASLALRRERRFIFDTVLSPLVGPARRTRAKAVEQSPVSLQTPTSLYSKISEGSLASFNWAPAVFVQAWHRSLSENYDIMQLIGEGGQGAVFIVKHRRNENLYACKFLHKVDHAAKTLRNEVDALRSLDHPNIVRLFEVNEDSETVFLLMELCRGGELYDLIEREESLSEPIARRFVQQMLSSLAYCHANGFVHRDVKPENFLLEDDDLAHTRLKLVDFGVSARIARPELTAAAFLPASLPTVTLGAGMVGSDAARCLVAGRGGGNVDAESFLHSTSYFDDDLGAGQVGSRPYMAPEILKHGWKSLAAKAKGSIALLAAPDLWSCGVVIFVMFSGEFPFGNRPDLRHLDGSDLDFSGPAWKNVSAEAIDLIRRLLTASIEDRWTAQQALGHAWFRDMSPRGSLSDGRCTQPEEVAGIGRAASILRNLRRWHQMPKLRRIVITAIARQLESQHESHDAAQKCYRLFGRTASHLSCDAVVGALNAVVGEVAADPALDDGEGNVAVASIVSCKPIDQIPSDPSSAASTAYGSTASWSSSNSSRVFQRVRSFLTWIHDRRRSRNSTAASRLQRRWSSGCSRIVDHEQKGDEDGVSTGRNDALTATMTPTPTTGSASSICDVPTSGSSAASMTRASLGELRDLVSSLDCTKNGMVDYSLLLAAMLPPIVYSDERRILEAFDLFDLQKRGLVYAEDLRLFLSGSGASLRRCNEMLAEFDNDGDGALSQAEFVEMVRGTTRMAACSPTPLSSEGRRG
eukprot:TRINITY_DN31078_c0_g1_i1.p1 TRINITY_DN31078_c0_g1~~TRINITY_DN31078_c0_g1_i1.p1  ORF type:complete len:925 (+),score=122.39 TRINITY_DN31078_c0_g1_i1:136-2910(+)